MKILPLSLLVGGLYFLRTKNYPFTKNKSEPITSKIGSKEIGYEIINCNKLIIHDKEKAFQFALSIGALEAVKAQTNPDYNVQSETLLLGTCFESLESENFKTEEEKAVAKDKLINQFKKLFNTKEKAKFYFEMEQWLLTGLVKAGIFNLESALNHLKQTKDNFSKYTGYDTSDLIVQLKM